MICQGNFKILFLSNRAGNMQTRFLDVILQDRACDMSRSLQDEILQNRAGDRTNFLKFSSYNIRRVTCQGDFNTLSCKIGRIICQGFLPGFIMQDRAGKMLRRLRDVILQNRVDNVAKFISPVFYIRSGR